MATKAKKLKIVLICGSIAQKSHTRALLSYLQDLLEEKEVETVFWDLRRDPLIIAQPEYHKNPLQNPDLVVQKFVKTIASAQGFILGTPLYHGSYSGVLKNALDNLSYDGFRDRPVALVCHGSGVRGGTSACDHLRTAVRALCGYTAQIQITTGREDYLEESEAYKLANPKIQERAVDLVTEFISLAKLLKNQEIVQS